MYFWLCTSLEDFYFLSNSLWTSFNLSCYCPPEYFTSFSHFAYCFYWELVTKVYNHVLTISFQWYEILRWIGSDLYKMVRVYDAELLEPLSYSTCFFHFVSQWTRYVGTTYGNICCPLFGSRHFSGKYNVLPLYVTLSTYYRTESE